VHKLIRTAVTDDDADADARRGIAVTGTTGYGSGTWQYRFDKQPWKNLGAVSEEGARLLPGRAYVRFVPNAGFTGEVRLRYRAWDQTQGVPGFLFNTVGNRGGSKSISLASETARLSVTPPLAAAISSAFASSSIVYEQSSRTPTAPQAPAIDAIFSSVATSTTEKKTSTILLSDEEESDNASVSDSSNEADFEDLSDDFFAQY
jgi:hypothetical protein